MDEPIRPTYNAAAQAGARDYMLRQLQQAGPAEQLVMLLDGICKFSTQAKEAIGRGDIAARCAANARAIEIVSHLLGMVDPSTGGEAAQRLFRIYGRLLQRLMRVDFENSAAICDEVIGHVRDLRAAFAATFATPQPAAAPASAVVAGPVPNTLLPVKRSATA